jgi:hypothetical protein
VPLIAVELGFGDEFGLTSQDADVLVRVTGSDVLWQKERLLNIGLRHLPPYIDASGVDGVALPQGPSDGRPPPHHRDAECGPEGPGSRPVVPLRIWTPPRGRVIGT